MGRVGIYVMAHNDNADDRAVLAFYSGFLEGALETCDSRELDRDTLEYVAKQFNESVHTHGIKSSVIPVDPDLFGGD